MKLCSFFHFMQCKTFHFPERIYSKSEVVQLLTLTEFSQRHFLTGTHLPFLHSALNISCKPVMTLKLSFPVTFTGDPRESEYVKEKSLIREAKIMVACFNRFSGQYSPFLFNMIFLAVLKFL